MKKFVSAQQRTLLKSILTSGELIFACGPNGISVNLVGLFTISENMHGDDQLDVGDGMNHAHIDWRRVKRAEVSVLHGEGVIAFFDGEEPLFKFYRPSGPFPAETGQMAESLAGSL